MRDHRKINIFNKSILNRSPIEIFVQTGKPSTTLKNAGNRKRRHPNAKQPDNLNNEMTSLAVIGPLVLQPLPVSLHTADLLAIVIGDRVGDRVGRWVDAEPSDTVVEFLLLLQTDIRQYAHHVLNWEYCYRKSNLPS